MNKETIKKHKTAIVIIGAITAVIAVVAVSRSGMLGDKAKNTTNKILGTVKDTASKASGSTATFPVTVSSPPEHVMKAYEQSGYIGMLENSIAVGTYPDSYIDSIKSDPVKWLQQHPYLYNAYPQYFKQ